MRRAWLANGALAWILAAAMAAALSPASEPPAHAQEATPSGPGAAFLPFAGRGFGMDARPTAPAVAATATTWSSPTPTATEAPTATATPTPTPQGYREPLTAFPDLEDLRDGYRAAAWYDTMLEALSRRYETGHAIVTRTDDSEANARRWAGSQTGSWDGLMRILPHVVHEMNHQLGMQEGVLKTGFDRYAYVVRSDLTLEAAYLETFPRREIARYVTGPLENMYKDVYLSGASGEQGFQNLLDEVNAYTHSLFSAYGVHDQSPAGRRSSHRDGLVTFLMYTQLYLRHAREHHPDDWQRLHDDADMRAIVAVLWDRAAFVLDVTEDLPVLSMDPAAIEAETNKPEMRAEIERFVTP